jgi:hypothetical protein
MAHQQYQKDPDYLGALTMWDTQVGRLMKLLKDQGVADDTAIFYTAGKLSTLDCSLMYTLLANAKHLASAELAANIVYK